MATLFRSDGWVKSAVGPATPGASVYVCNQPANVVAPIQVPNGPALPPFVPSPLASIFSDVNGLVPVVQPLITDGFGHYAFYAAPGFYTVVVMLGGRVQQFYRDQNVAEAGNIPAPLVAGANITIVGNIISATGGTAPVTSVFGRIGAVVAASGDYSVGQITGAAPTASPAFSGIPTAPTAAPLTSTVQLATTQFVTLAVAAAPGAVTSVFGRTGAVIAVSGDYSYAQISGTPQLPVTKAAVTSNFLTSYTSGTGLFTAAQPAASDLSNGTTGTGAVVLASAITGFGTGTVTSFSSGSLDSIATTSVATATSTPALSFTLSTQTANTVFAGPTTGAAAAPTFRALVAADLPAGTGGSVTSVAQTFTGGLITVSGSPITTSGTLALTVAGTSGGIPFFSSTSAWASSALLAAGGVVLGGGSGTTPATNTQLVFSGSTLTIGLAAAGTGILALKGTTSGVISIKGQAAAGTFNFNLPTTAGTAGQVLTSQGGVAAAMTWTTVTGTVSTGTANQLAFYSTTTNVASTTDITVGGGGALSLGNNGASNGSLTINNSATGSANLSVNTNGDLEVSAGIKAFGFLTTTSTKVVAAQVDKTNTTLTTVLSSLALLSTLTYRFRAVLYVNADAVGGGKYAVSAGAIGTLTATSIIYQVTAISNTTNLLVITSRQTALGGTVGQAGATTLQVTIEGTIVVNGAGNLAIQFAQNAASGTSSVLVGSTLETEPIP